MQSKLSQMDNLLFLTVFSYTRVSREMKRRCDILDLKIKTEESLHLQTDNVELLGVLICTK